jgi:tRNA A58 N-methylase Trm61
MNAVLPTEKKVLAIFLSKNGKLVTVKTDHDSLRMGLDDLRCRDIRVGDTLSRDHGAGNVDMLVLNKRPPWAMEFVTHEAQCGVGA